MQQTPDLKFVVDEQRGPLDVFTTWLPRLGVVVAFAFIGISKFDNDPRGEWFQIFEKIGLGQWFRLFTGATQLSGAMLLLTRWTRTIGAAMLASTMVGAMLVDLFIAPSPVLALVPLLLLIAIIAIWFTGRD